MFCNCGSSKKYSDCCEVFHNNHELVNTAEQLMRSRYCAFTLHKAHYIFETTLPTQRKGLTINDILDWAQRNKWIGLEIIKTTTFNVEFKAHYLDEQMLPQVHHEYSTFKKMANKWYFEKGTYPN